MLEDYLQTKFRILDKTSRPDPLGGVIYVYQEGAEFLGGAVRDTTTDAQIANQQGGRTLFTLVVKKGLDLERNQLIRRVDDGSNYKLLTDMRDMQTPDHAGLKCAQASMERVVL